MTNETIQVGDSFSLADNLYTPSTIFTWGTHIEIQLIEGQNIHFRIIEIQDDSEIMPPEFVWKFEEFERYRYKLTPRNRQAE